MRERGDSADGSFTRGRDGMSSTSVASVSFDESVPPLSASSSSSSLDVTRASLAKSMVGVTAAASQYSRSKNRSASWLMTGLRVSAVGSKVRSYPTFLGSNDLPPCHQPSAYAVALEIVI